MKYSYMKNFLVDTDNYKVISLAFVVSFVFYSMTSSDNVTPSIFLFYFIVIFYFAADSILEMNMAGRDSFALNKNFQWVITLLVFLVAVHLATGLTVIYLVDYCDGFFTNEIQCDLQSESEPTFEEYGVYDEGY